RPRFARRGGRPPPPRRGRPAGSVVPAEEPTTTRTRFFPPPVGRWHTLALIRKLALSVTADCPGQGGHDHLPSVVHCVGTVDRPTRNFCGTQQPCTAGPAH